MATRSSGLSATEAAVRLAWYGENKVGDGTDTGALRLGLRQVESLLVLIRVFGACISRVLREWTDASIILAIVIGSALLGLCRRHRAGQARAGGTSHGLAIPLVQKFSLAAF